MPTRTYWRIACAFGAIALLVASAAGPALAADEKKPNILVIWGDDIGISNVSAYSEVLMGYQTPNIDRLSKEGKKFTNYYAEKMDHSRP